MIERSSLRFMTCGSVDDGKSTLIGRLLFDCRTLYDDHIAALRHDSRHHGTTPDEFDFALLMDGLEAEREQGITIDVAYRFFSTRERSFTVIDAPGHEQYTRNMATGVTNADLVLILVDARKGILTQTRRHSAICAMFGLRNVVLAINKMDLVAFSAERFREIVEAFAAFAVPLGFRSIVPIPLSARFGDNLARRSEKTPWYDGPTLIEHLTRVDVTSDRATIPFRFPVQWVNRPHAEFRGYAGTVASGRIARGDRIVIARSGATTTIDRIVTADGDRDAAEAGDAVTLTLAAERDVARGDVLAQPHERPILAERFMARLLWLDEQPLGPGRSYLLRAGTQTVPARVDQIERRIDVETLGTAPADTLALNEIGLCLIATVRPLAFDIFRDNPATGSFILIDRESQATAGAGTIERAVDATAATASQHFTIDGAARASRKGQTPFVLWFTGLSGSGKSTIADLVERALYDRGIHTYALDGDNLRGGLNSDLGFTDADRAENVRRAGEVARLMADAGLVVLCSLISPFRAERQMVRGLMPKGTFIEVFVDASLDECIRRDPKGFYARALAGGVSRFTGIDSPYEEPDQADIVLRTAECSPAEAAAEVLRSLGERGLLPT